MPVAPHRSHATLVTSNGFTAALWDAQAPRLTGFREHLYAAVAQDVPVRDLAREVCFGLRVAGRTKWLPDSVPESTRYLPATGIIEVRQRVADLEATTFLFAPFELEAPAAVLLLRARNLGTAPLGPDAAVFAHLDFRVGEPDRGERLEWDASRGLLVERAPDPGSRVLVTRPLTPPVGVRSTPGAERPPLAHALSGPHAATGTETSSALQWSLEGLALGAEAWVGVAFAYHPFGGDAELNGALERWLAHRPIERLVRDEEARWEAFHRETLEPRGLSADERALYRQQVAFLRMGQVREPDDPAAGYLPHGQLVASLPPGGWNIAWVRDGAVAIHGLLRSGHAPEARAALAFFLRARAGKYAHLVGRSYRLSVVRYFGRGEEESDHDAHGPNAEWDGFGMFLDALDAYERATGDLGLGSGAWEGVADGTADVVVSLLTDEGLLQPDSSIWESHWDHGGRQQWTWSQVWGVVGLRAASAMAERRGLSQDASRWAEAADRLRDGLLLHLVDPDGVLRGRREGRGPREDASVVEAFCTGVLAPSGTVAQATLDRLLATLGVASGHGIRRNLGPGEYDAREWVFMDLRLSDALRRAGRHAEAAALLAWVTGQSRANFDLVAENYDPNTGDYAGAVPMIGFGAGAYVVALSNRGSGARR